MKTFLVTLVIVFSGSLLLWESTDGGQAFTAETARRLDVQKNPRLIPEWRLEDQNDEVFSLDTWRGHFVVVDFIYTSCPGVCLILSTGMRTLQDEFAMAGNENDLRLLSISFDPQTDTPDRLREHLVEHFSADPDYWIAARPISSEQLKSLLDFFKVVVIPDEYGGYTHSAGYHVIDPAGKLVAIFGFEQLPELRAYLAQALQVEEHNGNDQQI